MELRIQNFEACMTVKQLKEIIKDWPETNLDGEPTEVWIGTSECLSNPVREVCPLNMRTDKDGNTTADIIFE